MEEAEADLEQAAELEREVARLKNAAQIKRTAALEVSCATGRTSSTWSSADRGQGTRALDEGLAGDSRQSAREMGDTSCDSSTDDLLRNVQLDADDFPRPVGFYQPRSDLHNLPAGQAHAGSEIPFSYYQASLWNDRRPQRMQNAVQHAALPPKLPANLDVASQLQRSYEDARARLQETLSDAVAARKRGNTASHANRPSTSANGHTSATAAHGRGLPPGDGAVRPDAATGSSASMPGSLGAFGAALYEYEAYPLDRTYEESKAKLEGTLASAIAHAHAVRSGTSDLGGSPTAVAPGAHPQSYMASIRLHRRRAIMLAQMYGGRQHCYNPDAAASAVRMELALRDI